MYLRRFRLDEFIKEGESLAAYPETPSAFKVCSICQTDDPQTAEILQAAGVLINRDKVAFRLSMIRLLKVCSLGQPLKGHYDEKQCHDAFSFDYNGKLHTVWRIRSGDLRLLFYYGNDRIILLTDTFAKHKDRLTTAEINRSMAVVKGYLDAKLHTIIEELPNAQK